MGAVVIGNTVRAQVPVEECTFLCLMGISTSSWLASLTGPPFSSDVGESSHYVEHRHVTHVTATNTYYN